MMIHSEDESYQFKALQLTRNGDRTELGFDSEPPGSAWDNRTAGGVEWRLNVYQGDWKAPAGRYRDWMARAYDLEDKRRHRPAWATRSAGYWRPRASRLDARRPPAGPDAIHLRLANRQYDVTSPITAEPEGLTMARAAVSSRRAAFQLFRRLL
jgi:hypothetical protein